MQISEILNQPSEYNLLESDLRIAPFLKKYSDDAETGIATAILGKEFSKIKISAITEALNLFYQSCPTISINDTQNGIIYQQGDVDDPILRLAELKGTLNGSPFGILLYTRRGISGSKGLRLRRSSFDFESDSEDQFINYEAILAYPPKINTRDNRLEFIKILKALENAFYTTHKKHMPKNKIYLLGNEFGEMTLIPHEVNPMKINIGMHYHDDFLDVNIKLIKRLKETPKNNALIFLYGDPGTGKSNYLRYLASKIPDKNFVLITKSQLGVLQSLQTSADAVQLLANSVLILEDSEQLLNDRQSMDASSLTDSLLNLTDGMYLSFLKSHIIITFNTWPEKLDSALLRPGRLFLKYEFKALELEKTKKLLLKRKIDPLEVEAITEGKTLAQIYNWESSKTVTDLKKKKKTSIGFSA